MLVFTGVVKFNDPPRSEYPIRGVDVSSYQGEIDWQRLSEQNIDFAYIKATEGSNHVDECFEKNLTEARKTSLRIGAYHFFSFDSLASTQAENFINTVPVFDGMLPPVIDVEFYGEYNSKPPEDIAQIKYELSTLIKLLEDRYGMTPIIYATHESYKLFIENDFFECDVWIRDIWKYPTLPDEREWTFWQYSNRGRLKGYNGEERYIDLNVFCGSREDFLIYP